MGGKPGARDHVIAVVDDQEINRRVIGVMLQRMGDFHVVEGANGYDAIAIRFRYEPVVMIVNNMMPGLDGRTAIREIRRFESERAMAHVPIVFTSGDLMLAQHPVSARAVATLPLPLHAPDLRAALERFGIDVRHD